MAEPSPQMQPGSLPEDLRQLWQSLVGQLSSRGAAPARPAAAPAAAPTVPVVTANTAPSQQSLLEQLRQRVQEDIAPGPMTATERLSSFGRGVLANRGSLLDNLSAGLAAQESAQTARRAENLRAAETEGTIAYRDAQVRAEEAKQRYLENPNSWQARAELMKAEAQLMQARRPSREPQGSWQTFIDETTGSPVQVNSVTNERRSLTGLQMPRDPTVTGRIDEMAMRQASTDANAMRQRLEAAARTGSISERSTEQELRARGLTRDLDSFENQRFEFHRQRLLQNRPGTQQSQQQSSPQTQGGEATPPQETQPERVRSNYVPAPAR